MKRRIVMAGATFLLAAATGHVMQNGDVIGAKLRGTFAGAPAPADIPISVSKATTVAAVVPAPRPAPVTAQPVPETAATEPAKPALLQPARATLLPDFPSVQVAPLTSGAPLAARMERVNDDYVRPDTDADAKYSVFGIPCAAATLTLGLGARGALKASLSATCHPAERVVVSHAGLSFAVRTDAAGMATVAIPAMARDASVEAAFADGETVVAARLVPGLDRLRRVGLAGMGDMHLNAYENGAAFGAEGHYSAHRPGDAALPGGASVVTLGDATLDAPLTAEIYTASDAAEGVVVEAETEVTDRNCGGSVEGRVVTMAAGTPITSETLRQYMPGCDAVGDMALLPLRRWDGPLAVAAAGQ